MIILLNLAQFCGYSPLPTNNDSRRNDYYNRQSKIKINKKAFGQK